MTNITLPTLIRNSFVHGTRRVDDAIRCLNIVSRQFAVGLIATALVAIFVLASASGEDAAYRNAPTSAQAEMIGRFTGTFVDGAPVYQLPPLSVVTTRRAEWAKLQREQRTTGTLPQGRAGMKRPA